MVLLLPCMLTTPVVEMLPTRETLPVRMALVNCIAVEEVEMALCTNCVVATLAELSVEGMVGASTKSARVMSTLQCCAILTFALNVLCEKAAATNAVVATLVELSPLSDVCAVAVPHCSKCTVAPVSVKVAHVQFSAAEEKFTAAV